MILHVLMGQRKCSYPGEYAPEALEIMDEYAMEENEEWILEKKAYYENTQEFTALAIIDVRVNDDEVKRILTPPNAQIKGTIVPPT